MRFSFGSLLALTLVSDATKKGKNKENDNKVQFVKRLTRKSSGDLYSWPQSGTCVYEYNEDNTILTFTTVKGLNERTFCGEAIGCSDGYVLHRKISSIKGLQDCSGCEDPESNLFGIDHFSKICAQNDNKPNALTLYLNGKYNGGGIEFERIGLRYSRL